MTTSEIKSFLRINLLRTHCESDLARAKAAFKGLSPSQMAQPYGDSGKTRAEILAEYEAEAKKVREVRAFINAL
jgi:hypothetical protein